MPMIDASHVKSEQYDTICSSLGGNMHSRIATIAARAHARGVRVVSFGPRDPKRQDIPTG